MILSLYWTKLTSRGALAAMLTGFLSVPIYKFAAPNLPLIGESLATIGELPLAFVTSGCVAIVVSLLDHSSKDLVSEARVELQLIQRQ